VNLETATFLTVLLLLLIVLALFARIEGLRIARKLPDSDASWREYAEGVWIVLRTLFQLVTAPLCWLVEIVKEEDEKTKRRR
jgi:hypothetical protein